MSTRELSRGSELAIHAEGLHKTFGGTAALNRIDLSVPPGRVYGILGPNGAGKTTLIRILTTLLRPDAGVAKVFGRDVVADAQAVRSRVSLVGQSTSVDEDLTGRENLVMLARLLGYPRRAAKARADELLEVFGLDQAAGRLVSRYSGGMRRRLDIAAGIVVPADLVFLDEPTTGLDPRSRNDVWRLVRALVDDGSTVVLTTQYLDEADQLADRIAVLDHGRVTAEGTSAELKESVGSGVLHLRVADARQRAEAAEALSATLVGGVDLAADPAWLSARTDNSLDCSRALAALAAAEIPLTTLTYGQPSLDEVFLALTHESSRADLRSGPDIHHGHREAVR